MRVLSLFSYHLIALGNHNMRSDMISAYTMCIQTQCQTGKVAHSGRLYWSIPPCWLHWRIPTGGWFTWEYTYRRTTYTERALPHSSRALILGHSGLQTPLRQPNPTQARAPLPLNSCQCKGIKKINGKWMPTERIFHVLIYWSKTWLGGDESRGRGEG